jgi:hypothetical protein
VNIAYKHLEARLRIGELTPGQWASLVLGFALAAGWGMYLSPFGAYVSLLSAVYLGAIPAGAALLASAAEFDIWLLVVSVVRWRRGSGRYLPGPGSAAIGYRVIPDADERRPDHAPVPLLEARSLWDS